MDTRGYEVLVSYGSGHYTKQCEEEVADSMHSRALRRCKLRLTSSPSIRTIMSGCLASLRNKLRAPCLAPSPTSGPRFL
ncbi:hypothetical protein ARMGADRAFT_137380 [Armillaria gallica]|uniref:Uncharacterized protein n=1 Tax=Armillaria gallica TaxID=47427 RepID=A0A2H3C8F8_ARMGA|nr:hypothetical protein ARMGADRAFT_137380 [Armillaria gallica]